MKPYEMNAEVAKKFESYPDAMRDRLLFFRQLIFDVARESADIGKLEETLKWGEPSYISKIGSTLRMDWKEATPDHYYVFFHCQTRLVETFREVYGQSFRFEGNRAMVFHKDDTLDIAALKHCILLALRYHKVKNLPLLGA
ncbi:MAG TPA: DUF1801 domain-containing protein [Cellvibrionaceae bacterium]